MAPPGVVTPLREFLVCSAFLAATERPSNLYVCSAAAAASGGAAVDRPNAVTVEEAAAARRGKRGNSRFLLPGPSLPTADFGLAALLSTNAHIQGC